MNVPDEDGLGQEIARAIKVHTRYSPFRANSNILLRAAPFEVRHRLIPNPEIEAVVRAAAKTAHATELEVLCGVARYAYARNTWFSDWQTLPDHHILTKMVQSGCLPELFDEFASTSEPPSHVEAMRRAQHRGYNVPESYLKPRPVGYAEHEAWAAAVTLREGAGHFWESSFGPIPLTRVVVCVAGQFVVPDPVESDRPPYVVDQLWIVRSGDGGVRFLVLEIDEPLHQEPEKMRKDAKRDAMLTAMGYEVYRVASWWCAVDPYRALAAFFGASGILPGATNNFVGSELETISDYVCAHCGRPMVRWDEDWILRVFDSNGREVLIHRQCYSDAKGV